MNRKILLLSSLIIIIVLTACNDRDYITGQIGPSRGIVFNVDDCDLEAQIYKDNDDMSFRTAEKSAETLSVSTSWNKSTSDFRLPTEEEAETIMNNEYSQALWSDKDQPQTSYIWCEGNVAYNYKTKQIDTEVTNASLLVVRDLYSCEN